MRTIAVLSVVLLSVLLAFPSVVCAEDEVSQEDDEEKTEEMTELEDLRRAAEAASEKEEEETEETDADEIFQSGSLGLQALNPEISVTGDMVGRFQSGSDDLPTSETEFRTLDIHFESYLDPYSRFKAVLEFSVVEAELGEVYYNRFGVLWNINLTLGKFRQQFGIVNRWHLHALDWFNFPLALRGVFGPGGLNQVGLSLDWSASTGSLVHGLLVQVTDGRNPRVFGQNVDNRPGILGRYTFYHDLSASTYGQIGLTGLFGWNDTWATVDSTVINTRSAAVYGADLVVMWEPTDRMRYRNVEWRSEAYYLDKGIEAPDGSGSDRLKPWGLYSLLQTKVSRTVEIGVRYDYFSPEVKDYASLSDELGLAPLAVSQSDAYRQLAGAWLTWWQSPFVKFRGGYSFENGTGTGPDVHSVALQMVFAAGPHKHERY